jgi:2-desacetyl-2-hydroxyethyl bacteriochlorophyllide A dehydrogenase
MKRRSVYFTRPYEVTVAEEPLLSPAEDQVLIRTICSAISPGTEMLVYRGQWPDHIPIDESIPSLAGKFHYPLKYGYATVGRVVEIGGKVPSTWNNRLIFSFHPHESHFLASPNELIPVPENLTPEQAAFLPNMETAVSFLMDGGPIIGDQVVVLGQGVVGLLTTSLLARMPLTRLLTVDGFAARREQSLNLGAHAVFDPKDPDVAAKLREELAQSETSGRSDLTYELSGNPAALDLALEVTGFSGRIVIGSWYGGKKASVDLGGFFHRGRLRISSSQVSRIAPELTGLWTKDRRLKLALRMLGEIGPERLITHRIPVEEASSAYALIDRKPGDALQVIITYEA